MPPEILDSKRLKILKELSFLGKEGYYLAGGTALALQLGHRTSLDFDFYHSQHFDSSELFSKLQAVFGERVVERHREEDTLTGDIDGVHFSFFWYKYPLIRVLKDFEGVPLASIEDIAAMKIIAIVQRGTRRDFVDIYYLLKRVGLDALFFWTEEKYPTFNRYMGLRALIYFDDAEKQTDESRITIFDKKLTWEEVKKTIGGKVRDYQLEMLK